MTIVRLRQTVIAVTLLLLAAQPAAAAMLREVQNFGQNPGMTRMFIYVPDTLAAAPPVLVAIHYCGGNANAYFNGTGYRAFADRHGFILIYPQTTSSDGCFDERQASNRPARWSRLAA